MFSSLANKLIEFFSQLKPGVKTILYGTPEMVPTTAQPALLINAIGVDSVPTGSQGIPVSVAFKLYGITSAMADNYTATVSAQDFLWRYADNDDLGLYPLLLANRNKIIFSDDLGRDWVLFRISSPKIYAENTGKNYLGATEIDITLQTILHSN